MAVISALLLAMGVGRHYIDIYQKRTVRGISFLFVAIDALGDLFSLLSLGTSNHILLLHSHHVPLSYPQIVGGDVGMNLEG